MLVTCSHSPIDDLITTYKDCISFGSVATANGSLVGMYHFPVILFHRCVQLQLFAFDEKGLRRSHTPAARARGVVADFGKMPYVFGDCWVMQMIWMSNISPLMSIHWICHGMPPLAFSNIPRIDTSNVTYHKNKF